MRNAGQLKKKFLADVVCGRLIDLRFSQVLRVLQKDSIFGAKMISEHVEIKKR